VQEFDFLGKAKSKRLLLVPVQEAEYKALGSVVAETSWIRQLL